MLRGWSRHKDHLRFLLPHVSSVRLDGLFCAPSQQPPRREATTILTLSRSFPLPALKCRVPRMTQRVFLVRLLSVWSVAPISVGGCSHLFSLAVIWTQDPPGPPSLSFFLSGLYPWAERGCPQSRHNSYLPCSWTEHLQLLPRGREPGPRERTSHGPSTASVLGADTLGAQGGDLRPATCTGKEGAEKWTLSPGPSGGHGPAAVKSQSRCQAPRGPEEPLP